MNNTKMKLSEEEIRRAYTDYKDGLSWRKIEQKYGIYRTTMMTYFAMLGLKARDKKQLMYAARRLAMNNEEMLECVIRKKNGETVDALTLEKRVSGSLMQAVMTYFSRGYITGVQDGLKGINRLEGNEDEYTAYQMSFSLLAGDLNSMYDDLNADELPECFNDIMCGCGADAADDVLGFDEYENDYFGLNAIESKWAIEEAHKRLERMTKKQLMDMYTMCSRTVFQFMALRCRMDELDAAINILKSLNGEILRDVKTLCSLYDELEEHPNDWKLIEKFDAAAQMLPEEAWLR